MTTTELRALDLEMAEKVMGWKPIGDQGSALYPEFRYWRSGNGDVWYGLLKFQPTVQPADAMMVLKKLMEKCWILLGKTSDGYWAQEHEAGTEGKGPTIEIAICLLAREAGR